MSTLIQRLKQEHKTKLELEQKLYPSTISPVIEELKKKHFIIDLSYGDVLKLQTHTNETDVFSLFYYYVLYRTWH